LQSIESWDLETINKILPFVKISDAEVAHKYNFSEVMKMEILNFLFAI